MIYLTVTQRGVGGVDMVRKTLLPRSRTFFSLFQVLREHKYASDFHKSTATWPRVSAPIDQCEVDEGSIAGVLCIYGLYSLIASDLYQAVIILIRHFALGYMR